MNDCRTVIIGYAFRNREPCIILTGGLDADFAAIQRCFREMSTTGREVDLECMEFICQAQQSRAVRLRLITTNARSAPRWRRMTTARRLAQLENALSFEWARSASEWDDLAELLDTLVESEKPCHQYLAQFPIDDATVIISKGEYSK